MSELFLYRDKSSVLSNTMKQSEELMKHGYVTSGGGRAKVIGGFAHGTVPDEGDAFVQGSYKPGTWNMYQTQYTQNNSYKAPVVQQQAAAPVKSAAKEAKEEFEETIDWVEVALDRIEREVKKFDTLAGNIYRLFSDRNQSLIDGFNTVTEQIKYQQAAYETYMNKVNSMGVDTNYMEKIRNGEWSIEDIKDEDLHKKVTETLDWYNKALDARDVIVELEEKLGEIAKTKFDNMSTKYDLDIEAIEHGINMLEGQLDIIENRGNFAGRSYYEALVKQEESSMKKLQEEYDELTRKRYEALNSGYIAEGSEGDLEMVNTINEVAEAWQEAKNSMLEYKNDWLEMDSDAFEWMNDKISQLTQESEFIRDLMALNEEHLFVKETGRFNEKGLATGALHAMDYNVLMDQADLYRKKVEEMNKAIANDPNNTILIDKRDEYLKLQQESIKAADEERKAMRDLLSESYDRMLKILNELIEKRQKLLEGQHDLYNYQRTIEEKTDNIGSLQKQLMSLQGDDSEETKAKRQELSDQLKDAQKDLEATEYDQWLKDQEQLMSEMVEEYERVFNERLDDVSGIVREFIDYANTNASEVKDTITTATQAVGYQMTQGMQDVWSNKDLGINKVMTEYRSDFLNQMTTVNKYVNGIYLILKQVTKTTVDVDKPVQNVKKEDVKKPAPAQPKPSTPAPAPAKKAVKVGGMINAGSAPIYNDSQGGIGPYGTHQYFASDPIYVVMKDYGNYILVRHHTQSSGAGFFRKDQVTALKTGGETGNMDGFAMLHKKERVLSAAQTKAFDKLVYDYLPSLTSEFMKNSGLSSLKNGSSYQTVNQPVDVNNNIEMNFNLPNVSNANDFIRELQSNKQFEQIVQHLAFDSVNGKSSLRKNIVRVGKK